MIFIANDNDISVEQLQLAVSGVFVNDAVVTFTLGERAVSGKVEGATNADPIVITSTAHGLATGDLVVLAGVQGNTAANTTAAVTKVDADSFSLDDVAGNADFIDADDLSNRGDWFKVVSDADDVSMPYVAGSHGIYRGVLPGTVSLEPRARYVLVIRASNYNVEFVIDEVADIRRR